jgi:hypothetical protein
MYNFMDGCIDRWMHKLMDGCIDSRMDVYNIDRWMDV